VLNGTTGKIDGRGGTVLLNAPTKLPAIVALALVPFISLIGGAYLYERHVQRRDDAVATFAIGEIQQVYSVCLKQPSDPRAGCLQGTEQMRRYMKTHTASETAMASMDCLAANAQREFRRLDACEQSQQTALQEWGLKYPKQAAQAQATLLEWKRRQDANAMKKSQ